MEDFRPGGVEKSEHRANNIRHLREVSKLAEAGLKPEGVSAGMPEKRKVVILGGGFGGLYAARALKRADVEVTLIDRRNFHLFQPLLYQVATGALSPGEIASPIRGILHKQRNTRVLMGEVVDIDPAAKQVVLRGGDREPHDTLIVATGATHHYFGHPEWEQF